MKTTPKNNHHSVETFIQAFQNNFSFKEQEQKSAPNNLSTNEKEAFNSLANRGDMFITKADKGDAVVTVDVDDYVNEALQKNKNNPAEICRL